MGNCSGSPPHEGCPPHEGSPPHDECPPHFGCPPQEGSPPQEPELNRKEKYKQLKIILGESYDTINHLQETFVSTNCITLMYYCFSSFHGIMFH